MQKGEGAGPVRSKYEVLSKDCGYAPPQNPEESLQIFHPDLCVSPGTHGKCCQAEPPLFSPHLQIGGLREVVGLGLKDSEDPGRAVRHRCPTYPPYFFAWHLWEMGAFA